jgi:transcriptional regulator with XRE-family HTH domain
VYIVLHSRIYRVTSMTFGEQIKKLREKKGYSQRQFAIALDITPTYMSKIERGEFSPPSEEVIKNMAELLEEDSDILLSYANKVDSDLLDIIKNEPAKYAALLRQWAKKAK